MEVARGLLAAAALLGLALSAIGIAVGFLALAAGSRQGGLAVPVGLIAAAVCLLLLKGLQVIDRA